MCTGKQIPRHGGAERLPGERYLLRHRTALQPGHCIAVATGAGFAVPVYQDTGGAESVFHKAPGQ